MPAESCRMSPVDRLFTRLGASDHIMSGTEQLNLDVCLAVHVPAACFCRKDSALKPITVYFLVMIFACIYVWRRAILYM